MSSRVARGGVPPSHPLPGTPIFSINFPDDCFLDRDLLLLRGWTPALIRKYLPDSSPIPGAGVQGERGRGILRRPVRRQRLRSFLELDDVDGVDSRDGGGGGGNRAAMPGHRHRRAPAARWHLHRVQLVECTEHFVHDYARSLHRRRVYRTRISQFHQWRLLMARAFQAYRDSLEGPQLVELACLMIDHRQAIESAAGMRFPAKGG